MEVNLAGRRILVTGAAGGLGAAITRRLAECSAELCLSDLSAEALDAVAADAKEAGAPAAVPFAADLTEPAAARGLAGHAAEALGGLDGLVSCAGLMRTTPYPDLGAAEWQRVIDINLTGVHTVTQAAANLMREGGGSVVMVASVAARSGRPDAAHYAASKAAQLSLTKSLALAYAPKVRVNAVCPGVFLTPMWDGIMRDRDERFGPGSGDRWLHEVRDRTPLGRTGDPGELANAVAFLCSDLASFITGQAVNVDGGLEMD